MIAQLNGQIGLAYAFVEREIALSKRYWAWEIVWLVYGIALHDWPLIGSNVVSIMLTSVIIAMKLKHG